MMWRTFWARSVEPQIGRLSERTRDEYRRLWRRDLRPLIGSMEVSKTDWRAANAALTSIESPTVQRHAGALLRKICNMAVREGLLKENPVKAIQYAPHRKKRRALVDSLHVHRFIEGIKGIKYEPLLLLELGAGLRVEEACALTWEDLSELEFLGRRYCAVNVDKALVLVRGGTLLKCTKNSTSERTAICGEPFASRVIALREGKSGPLVANGGAYTSPSTITHNWRAWCRDKGVEYVTPKDLRASYATIMGEAGAQDSVVSGNMGHADATTKAQNYQAVTIAAKCRAADCLAEWLRQLAPSDFSGAFPQMGRGAGPKPRPQFNHGASDRNRTRNPLITKDLNTWADLGLW